MDSNNNIRNFNRLRENPNQILRESRRENNQSVGSIIGEGNKENDMNKENIRQNKRKLVYKAKVNPGVQEGPDKFEDKYCLLKRKVHRPTAEEESEINSLREPENMSISVNPFHLHKLSQETIKKFSFHQENSKFNFKVEGSIPNFRFNLATFLQKKHRNTISLTVIKSNINLSMISRHFVITEHGIDCSQKTHNTSYISIGRQQVNDQGIRPNDIMLFPTDPSISRSHFKIHHKEYFDRQKEFDAKKLTMLSLSIDQEVIFHILKYISPPKKVMVEDNGTIYGTYIRVRALDYQEFMSSFLVLVKNKRSEDIFGDNFGISQTLECFWSELKEAKEGSKISNCLPESVYAYRHFLRQIFDSTFDYFNDPSSRTKYDNFLNFLRQGSDFKFWVKNSLLSDAKILEENTLTVNKLLPAVFLNNSKLGFILAEIGPIESIIEALRNEFLEFNGEGFNSHIEVISLDKIFDFQKIDSSSQIYKGHISKEELVYSLQFFPCIKDYSILFFIETCGDPCGVMNRVNDVLFLHHKGGQHYNRRSFSFNFVKGFLLGNNPKSCYITNSETDTFLYYNHVTDKWGIQDLTRFLNPSLYFSGEYHGLWICTSHDKKSSNRFQAKKFLVKSDDEIKVSETVMKVKISEEI